MPRHKNVIFTFKKTRTQFFVSRSANYSSSSYCMVKNHHPTMAHHPIIYILIKITKCYFITWLFSRIIYIIMHFWRIHIQIQIRILPRRRREDWAVRSPTRQQLRNRPVDTTDIDELMENSLNENVEIERSQDR